VHIYITAYRFMFDFVRHYLNILCYLVEKYKKNKQLT